MNKRASKLTGSFFAAACILFIGQYNSFGQNSGSFCSERFLPKKGVVLLREKFRDWRIKTVEDMEPAHQALWQQNRFMDCPGLAKGHFTGTASEEIGLLLVPRQTEKKGFKVVVLAQKPGGSGMELISIKSESMQDQERFVVYMAPAGLYSNYNKTKEVELQSDGIYLEDLEMGSTLVYWKNSRFETLEMVR